MIGKRWATTVVAVVAVGALSGCGNTAGSTDYWTKVQMVDVNGRQVPCVIWKSYNVGGISCDWSAK